MTALLIDGKKAAGEIRLSLKQKIAAIGQHPSLAIILVGEDEGSLIYVRNKIKAAAEIGITTNLYKFAADIEEKTLSELIEKLNNDTATNGIIVQLPLPDHMNTNRIINMISPLKDVDGFHPYNTGMLQNNEKPYFTAATPLGIMYLLQNICPTLSGKNVVIIGASLIVGRPLATLLLNQECTVTVTHIRTRNIKALTSQADILIAACGVANLVTADWIKDGAILIDVGINRLPNGSICGDINFAETKEKAAYITPVPGGVGPMTIAMLLQNTFDAYILQRKAV
jgi:methylenetetrahydrofolate dehydrogenase (NADP+)/methenyltetrahydrofolate cyclohydrolase